MKQALAAIARRTLGFKTLETRNSGSHDFKDCSVWCVKQALEAAYEAGREAAYAECTND